MHTTLSNFDWGQAAKAWGLVVLIASVVGYFLASLRAGLARGSLIDGFVATAGGVIELFRDMTAFSWRRIWALAWHSVLESVRRRMLLAVFVIVAVVFMFGGWFLESRPTEQVKIYVSFVMLAATLTAIPAGGLLACLSLPSDIRDKTIHTVVTKPVRRLEIIVGRTLGLTIVITVFLFVMGVFSYVYMRRSVGGSLDELQQKVAEAKKKGDTRYEAELTDSIEQINGKLTARIPVFATELFGPNKNVGFESSYRLFIEGNSPDAAVWVFDNVPAERILAAGSIPLEMLFAVFRTYKGEVGRGVLAQITYTNPATRRQITDYPFEVREYYVIQRALDGAPDPGRIYVDNGQALPEPPAKPLEWLLDKNNGQLLVEVRCLSGAHYLGIAHSDLYILFSTASFGVNFLKGMVGVWLRVMLIVCVAVMFSTFLSSYVAMLATAGVFVGGLCMTYLRNVAQ